MPGERIKAWKNYKAPGPVLLIALSAVLTGILLLISSCQTNRYTMGRKVKNPESYRYELTLTYLDEETLIERFGTRDNPYISPYTLNKNKMITSFDLTIVNRSAGDLTIKLPLQTTLLYVGNKSYTAQNQFRLGSFWESFPKQQGQGTSRKKQAVINETLLENATIVKSGETKSGILAFMGNVQIWSEPEVHIPLFTERDEFIDEYSQKITYE